MNVPLNLAQHFEFKKSILNVLELKRTKKD